MKILKYQTVFKTRGRKRHHNLWKGCQLQKIWEPVV